MKCKLLTQEQSRNDETVYLDSPTRETVEKLSEDLD